MLPVGRRSRSTASTASNRVLTCCTCTTKPSASRRPIYKGSRRSPAPPPPTSPSADCCRDANTWWRRRRCSLPPSEQPAPGRLLRPCRHRPGLTAMEVAVYGRTAAAADEALECERPCPGSTSPAHLGGESSCSSLVHPAGHPPARDAASDGAGQPRASPSSSTQKLSITDPTHRTAKRSRLSGGSRARASAHESHRHPVARDARRRRLEDRQRHPGPPARR